jgi:hypothetical protein
MKKLLLGALGLLFLAGPVLSLDFGLLADQRIEAEKGSVSYHPILAPWFSWDGGKGLSCYLSGILSLVYRQHDGGGDEGSGWEKPLLLPELSRFVMRYRSNRHFLVEAGRGAYADTLGFAASGLFDGLRLEADFSFGSIRAGGYYTGFLYKKTANIMMTPGDMERHAEPLAQGREDESFLAGYFASRRVLVALRWEAPLLEFHTLSLEALAQFDCNDSPGFPPGERRLHSQYGEIQAALFPGGALGLNIGAVLETMENDAGEFAAALGGLFAFKAELPGALNDSLTGALQFASGNWNDTFIAFRPLSSSAQGAVFAGTLSGLAILSADYAARLGRSLYMENTLRYFARSWEDPAAAGAYLYGGELWASLAWQPVDELRLSLGGGAFFPGLGTIDPSGEPHWKVAANLALSF